MGVTVTLHAKLIAALGNSGAGADFTACADTETSLNSNSILEVAGTFYVLVMNGSSDFQWYKSTDAGATWATTGAAFTPDRNGDGLAQVVKGTTIWNCYTGFGGTRVYLTPFDTLTHTWGTEQSIVFGGFGGPIGPFSAYLRPDNSMLFLVSNHTKTSMLAVVSDGVTFTTINVVVPSDSNGLIFQSSLMRGDGTVDLFFLNFGSVDLTLYTDYHSVIHPDNSVVAPAAVITDNSITDWYSAGNPHSAGGLGSGVLSSGIFYLPCGIRAGSGITSLARAGILFGSDGGGWTLGSILDTGAPAGYSVMPTLSLHLMGTTLIYRARYIDFATGTHYLERIGFAPLASYNSPVAWTWATVYDFTIPTLAVGTETAPYRPADINQNSLGYGNSTGLVQTATDIRMVTTLVNNGGDLFVAYLYDLTAAAAKARRNDYS